MEALLAALVLAAGVCAFAASTDKGGHRGRRYAASQRLSAEEFRRLRHVEHWERLHDAASGGVSGTGR